MCMHGCITECYHIFTDYLTIQRHQLLEVSSQVCHIEERIWKNKGRSEEASDHIKGQEDLGTLDEIQLPLERRHIKIHHKCCILVNITHHLLQVTHVYSTLSCCASGKRLSWVIIYECDKQIHSPRLSHPIQMDHQEVAKTPDSYLLISLKQLPTINSSLFHAYGHGSLWFVFMDSCSLSVFNVE